MATSPAILVEDLHYTYRKGQRDHVALEGLNFSVAPGEIFGLLGPNGAGKTTAVKILTTILRPAGGRALVNGNDVERDPLGARRSLAAVLQESAVETLLSVWDNLFLYGMLHGLGRADIEQRARRVVDLLGLEGTLSQRAQELSGGFKRRLQVAKALMVETPILFLDEATTGMDPLIARRTLGLLREQAARGRTVLLTTHLLDEAEELCDRMVLMRQGRAVAGGTLDDLRGLSQRALCIQLRFTHPAEESFQALRDLSPRSLDDRNGEVEMVVEGSEDEWIRAMARISESFPFARFEIRGASLEQIFLDLYDEGGEGG